MEKTYELLNVSCQGVRRLFVLAYVMAAGAANDEKGIKNNIFFKEERLIINILIDGRNFYGQPINDLTKQYDKVRRVSSGQGDDYTTGCLLDYA